MQLPKKDEDAWGDDVEFADEGTEIWATECMLSNANALPRVPERVTGVREHDCDKFDCSLHCKRPKYDFRVKWDGMRSQCSTWESCIQRIGLKLASKGVMDNYGTRLLVKDVEERFSYLENHDDMLFSLRLKMVKNLDAHCEHIMNYFNDLYAQWGNENDSDDEFPNPFENPTELYPMTCQMSPLCKDKTDDEMTAYCAICNERGHPTCMVDMPNTIRLHPEQDKGAKEFKLTSRLCAVCDNYHGLFYRVHQKCTELLPGLKQQAHTQATTTTPSASSTTSSGGNGEGGLSIAVPSRLPGQGVRCRGGGKRRTRQIIDKGPRTGESSEET